MFPIHKQGCIFLLGFLDVEITNYEIHSCYITLKTDKDLEIVVISESLSLNVG